MRIKRIGSTRRVELHDGFVIKYAKNMFGRKANRNEVKRYEFLQSKYLCPIINYSPDYKWIVMVRANIPKFRTRLLYSRYLKMKLHTYKIGDIHWYNVGELDGEPVLFDYGESWFSFRIWKNVIPRGAKIDDR